METLQTVGDIKTSTQKSFFTGAKFLIVFAILIVALVGLFFIFKEKNQRETSQDDLKSRLAALEELQKQVQPLTPEETKSRLAALNTMQKEVKPLTQEEIQSRLQALETLKGEQVTLK